MSAKPTPTSLQSAVAALEALGCHPTPTNGGSAYTARCPCHDDSTPSLSISTGDRQAVILHCHAGCDPRAIFKALGIQANPATDKRRIVATYDYHDAQGAFVSQKVRYEPKDFRQRWPDGHGGWLWKRPSNAPYVLYRLPELLAAIEKGETVYLVEGEKDCDRLAALGLAATTNIEGAAKPDQKAKWRADYTAQLMNAARVILLPDNDEPGRAHMAHVAKLLGQRATVVTLPGLPEKGDVTVWLSQGHTADELKTLAEHTSQGPTLTFIPAPGSPWRQINDDPEDFAREKFSMKSSESSGSSESIAYKFPSLQQPFSNPSANPSEPFRVTVPNLETVSSKGSAETVIDSKAAQMLASVLSGRLAFCRDTQLWHGFTGTHWQPFTSSAVADELITRLVYAGTPVVGFEARYLNALTGLLRKGLLPLPEPMPESARLIPFANGLLDPVTRSLAPITPDNAATWSLPYAYTPAADCPTIKAWLKKAVGNDQATVEFLRAWLAALLTGRADLQKFLHLIGPGGTGKGTFIRLAKALVGHENAVVTDLRSLEQNRFETAALYGKRLAAITDTSRYGGSVDVFKALTGQDPLRLERKHQQQTATFHFAGMALLASNEAIQTTDLTGALERRRLTVRFDHVASDEERRLWDSQGGESAVLHREIPGLVNWLLALSREDVTRLITQRPAKVEAANMEALRVSNPIADWLMDSLVPDPDGKIKVGDKRAVIRDGLTCFEYADHWLYPSYLTWCQRNGREALSLTRFSGLVLDMGRVLGTGFTKERSEQGVHIKGLRWPTPADLPEGSEGLTLQWLKGSCRTDIQQPIDSDEHEGSEGFSDIFIPTRAHARENPSNDPSLAARILGLIGSSPAGITHDEIARQCGNGKGASSAMIENVLHRLAVEGVVSRQNGRWVAVGAP